MTKSDDTLGGAKPIELITPKQLSRQLQISRATIQRHVARGMPHEKFGARIIRFQLDDVVAWLRNQGQARRVRRRAR